jgi:hypothetical protein
VEIWSVEAFWWAVVRWCSEVAAGHLRHERWVRPEGAEPSGEDMQKKKMTHRAERVRKKTRGVAHSPYHMTHRARAAQLQPTFLMTKVTRMLILLRQTDA